MPSQSSESKKTKKNTRVPLVLDKKVIGEYDDSLIQQFKDIFVENLHTMLVEWHMNKVSVAKICNVSKPSVTQWFAGRVFPTTANLRLLAKEIDRNPQSFFKKGGICKDNYDGGFKEKTYYKSENNNLLSDTSLILYGDFYDNVIKDNSILVEKETLEKAITSDLEPLNREEQILIANWRLLTPQSKSHIFHSIFLESNYSRDEIKKNNKHRIKVVKKSNAEKNK